MIDRITRQTKVAFLLTLLIAFATNAVAREEVKRIDNGPFFSEPNEFLNASSEVLNTAENSLVRLESVALVQRAVGGRAAHQDDIAGRSLDELARYYIMSVDGWTTNSTILSLVVAFSNEDSTKELAAALSQSTVRYPDRTQMNLPLSQRITLAYGEMLSIGGALLSRDEPKKIAGQYVAQVSGDCSFESGPVEIIQDQFLLEGRRDDSLIFWGAIGETRAYFATAENKYLKMTLKRRGKRGQIEFPDKASDLFSAVIGSEALSLKGEFFGECEIALTKQVPAFDAVPENERQPTRLNQHPLEKVDERVDTPGVMLTMQEVSRSGKGRKLEITYKFLATGFPAGVTYSFWRYKPQPKPAKLLNTLSVDESGVMLVNELTGTQGEWPPSPLESAIPLTLYNVAPGEPFEFGIVSEDESIQAFTTVYPVPIETRDRACHLNLERLNPGQTLYRAYATGLTPGEEMRIESESGDVVLQSLSQADENGEFSAYVFPEVPGETFGAAEYRVRADSCSPSIGYEWGVRR